MTYYERANDDRPLTADELLDMALGRPEWMERGECRTERALTLAWTFGHESIVDLFVPSPGRGRRAVSEIVAGRTLCADCGVKAECLAYALEHHPQAGTWGGTTFPERIAIRKKEGHR